MQVQVEDPLSCIGAVVDPDRVAALPHPEALRHLAGDLQQSSCDPLRQLRDLLQRTEVLPGDDEHVYRRQPPYVLEGEHLILVMYHLGVHLPSRNPTKYAVSLVHAQLLPMAFSQISPAPPAPGPPPPSRRSRCATGTARAALWPVRPPPQPSTHLHSTRLRDRRRCSPVQIPRPRGLQGQGRCAAKPHHPPPVEPPPKNVPAVPPPARAGAATVARQPRLRAASARPSRHAA